MKYEFTEQDRVNEANKIELDGEEVTLIGEYIEDVDNEDNTYTMTGDAVIEGELYHEFVTIFATEGKIENPTAKSIAQAEWDWFDYVCD